MTVDEREPLTIPVVLGSVRPNRRSERPARLLVERLAASGCRADLIDLRALNLPMYGHDPASDRDPAVLAMRETLARSDASVWLSPEFNHSFSSAIKNAIDYLQGELRRKPVLVCGLSGGMLGGARCVEQLKLVLIELHALPIRDSVYFSDARNLYDEAGALLRPEFVRRADEAIAELIWYARALRWGRDNVPVPIKRK
jgi:NAD(P)H-dependent FMN reductase